MGMLVNGEWINKSIITSDQKGSYDRLPRTFRNYISKDDKIFKPESGRYHLYVSYACPWATRTLIYRKLKKLEEHISVDVVHPDMLVEGWVFDELYEGSTKETLYGFSHLYQIYQKANSAITTSVTVPVLWDKKTETIVNNESSEIIRMFDLEFDDLTGIKDHFYPLEKRKEIDELNEIIYYAINNGVYKTGFAKNQKSYDEACFLLFDVLDELDERLAQRKYLLGDRLTEADLRLAPTLLRFDIVYVTHFKCNIRRIKDYKNLSRYLKDLYNLEEIKSSTNFDHIKRHYFYSHIDINPYRIIPKGPQELF